MFSKKLGEKQQPKSVSYFVKIVYIAIVYFIYYLLFIY